MLRACGDVIAKDTSEPMLSSDFASRITAALPSVATMEPAGTFLQTRRDLRKRFWRRALGGIAPAAAAVLFFGVLVFPTDPNTTRVAGESYEATVKKAITPTLDAVSETTRAARTLNRLLEIPVDAVAVNNHAEQPTAADQAPKANPGLMEIFLSPFEDMLKSPDESAASNKAKPEIVRF